MNSAQATYTLVADSSAYVVAADTRVAAMVAFDCSEWFEVTPPTPSVYYSMYRMKEQALTYSPSGVSLRLKASGTPQFPIVFNEVDSATAPSTSAHYFVSTSSTAVMNVVRARWLANGEMAKVYWGEEWKLDLQLWVRPK